MNKYLLTLNCQPLDQQLFEDLVPYLLSRIDDPNVLYNIEYPDDPRKHFHAIFQHDSENPKFDINRYFNNAEFKKYISNSNSKNPQILNIKKIRKNELANTIGYIFKSNVSTNSSYGNYEPYEILKFIELYLSTKRLQNRIKQPQSDLIQITSKNINSYYEHEKQLDYEINPENFMLKMISKYTFINITQNQLNYFKKEQSYREALACNPAGGEKYYQYKEQLLNYLNKDDDYYDNYKVLVQFTSNLIQNDITMDPEEIPQSIKNILKLFY